MDYTTGKYGNAITLDGIGHYVNFSDPPELELSSEFTISAWENHREVSTKDLPIAGKIAYGVDETYGWGIGSFSGSALS